MLMYLYFGDYYNDGHGRFQHILVDAPSQENVEKAIREVKYEFPDFFDTFAADAWDSSIGPDVEKALLKTKYPIEKFKFTNDDPSFESFTSLEELFQSDFWKYERGYSIYSMDFVMDAVIWVLNFYDAGIIPADIKYPWFDFECGYGLFYD